MAYHVMDLEFTHASHLIEIGVVSLGDSIQTFFHTLVKPAKEVDSHVTKLTGITQGMLEDSPTEREALLQLIASFRDVQHPHIIVWGTDEKIIKKAARRHGLEPDLERFHFFDLKDVLSTLRFFFPHILTTTRNSLHEVATNLGCIDKEQPQTHRALDDAFEAALIVQKLKGLLQPEVCF